MYVCLCIRAYVQTSYFPTYVDGITVVRRTLFDLHGSFSARLFLPVIVDMTRIKSDRSLRRIDLGLPRFGSGRGAVTVFRPQLLLPREERSSPRSLKFV